MLTSQEILLRLVVATVLGSLVGLERERLNWAPGLRTHMLVCLGATLFMIVSAFGFADILGTTGVTLDPSRIAAQVVSGIGFLGAGVIILRKEVIRGLTTAASIWTVAAIGLAVGGGLYLAACASTVIVLVILAVLKPVERRLFRRGAAVRLKLTVDRRRVALTDIVRMVEGAKVSVVQIMVEVDGADQERVLLQLQPTPSTDLLPLIESIRNVDGVRRLNYTQR